MREGLELNRDTSAFLLKAIQLFDCYVDNEINSKLPEGYRLSNARNMHYDEVSGCYEVTTGDFQVSDDAPEVPPKRLEDIVLPLLEEYQRKHIWIGKIIKGFSLSK